MTGLDIFELIQKGGWGVAALFALVIVYLERTRNAATSENQANVKLLLQAIADFKEVLRELTGSVDKLREVLAERRHSLVDISRQLDTVDGKVRHGFGNVSQSLTAIVRFLGQGRHPRAQPLIPLPAPDEEGDEP